MTPANLLALTAANLGRRTGRVALTAIGVVIGTAAVIVLVSLGLGLQRGLSIQMGSLQELTQIQISPNWGEDLAGNPQPVEAPPGGGAAPAFTPTLITDESMQVLQALPHVQGVYPQVYLDPPTMFNLGKLEGYGSILGLPAGALEGLGLNAAQGSLELSPGRIIAGALTPMNFYNPRMRPGEAPPEPPDLMEKTLKMTVLKWSENGEEKRKSMPLQISGVLQETRGAYDYSFYMLLEDVEKNNQWYWGRRVDRNKEGYPLAVVTVDQPKNVLDIAEFIEGMGFRVYTPQTFIQGINSFFLLLQIGFGAVGAITLLVAAIGIANTMTMATLERTREIGLMKAIGATNRDVLAVFLLESAGIGSLGGLGGVFIGWILGSVINVLALAYMAGQAATTGGLPPSVAVYTPSWLPLSALLFATLIGLLSGLYPSLRAANMVPVEALKYE